MKNYLTTSLLSIALAGSASAGVISVVPLTDDASSGISTANTYTHAVSGGSAQTVNGVSLMTRITKLCPLPPRN